MEENEREREMRFALALARFCLVRSGLSAQDESGARRILSTWKRKLSGMGLRGGERARSREGIEKNRDRSHRFVFFLSHAPTRSCPWLLLPRVMTASSPISSFSLSLWRKKKKERKKKEREK